MGLILEPAAMYDCGKPVLGFFVEEPDGSQKFFVVHTPGAQKVPSGVDPVSIGLRTMHAVDEVVSLVGWTSFARKHAGALVPYHATFSPAADETFKTPIREGRRDGGPS